MKWLLVGVVALLPWLVAPLVRGQEPAAPLQGAFAVTIAPEDVPPDLIDGASLIGRWQVAFNADGTYVLGRQDVGPVASGAFATAGDALTLRAESGLLACAGADGAAPEATYTWRLRANRLLLIADEEPCARRRLLLTTRTLAPYAACPPLALAATPVATPTGIATPVAAVTEADIDTLLSQLSDCWATRAPDRFLPLLGRGFQATLQPGNPAGARRMRLLMAAPLIWERAGDVEIIDASHARARVRQISGDEVDELPFEFVYEDGAWRWDGIAVGPGGTPAADASSG
jgi:hypothetical protein